jgi:hypothetical protein
MRKVAFALGAFLPMLLWGGAAQAQTCAPGSYFCPGKIAGCCPNGWGCGSTRCIPPKKSNQRFGPVRYGNCYWDGTRPFCAGSCRPGFVRLKREGSGCITGSRVYCCEPMATITQP